MRLRMPEISSFLVNLISLLWFHTEKAMPIPDLILGTQVLGHSFG